MTILNKICVSLEDLGLEILFLFIFMKITIKHK